MGGGPAFAALFSRRLDVLVDIHFARAAGRHARDSPVARWEALKLERDLRGAGSGGRLNGLLQPRRLDGSGRATPQTSRDVTSNVTPRKVSRAYLEEAIIVLKKTKEFKFSLKVLI